VATAVIAAALGVGAFVAVAHTSYMLDHTLAWNFKAFDFMLQQQLALAGGLALGLMTPAAAV